MQQNFKTMIKTLYENETQTIVFNKTANLFINIGIVALHRYIDKYLHIYPNKFEVIQNTLDNNTLTIECNELMPLLEEVYYCMGKEVYDISTKKQIEAADKYYFVKEPTFAGVPFAKMKTLGMAYLVTNDSTAIAGKGGEKMKFEALIKEQPEFALQIALFLESKGKKLKYFTVKDGDVIPNPKNENGKTQENKGGESEIFLYNGYTKIPELEFNLKYLQTGAKTCPITNKNFKVLVENKCTFPFGTNHSQISWQAVLASRFAPALCFYAYKNSYNSLICHFFNSNNLLNISNLYADNLFKTPNELLENSFISNFNLVGTKRISKNSEDNAENIDDSVWASEVAFMLIYTFYKTKLQKTFSSNNADTLMAEELFGEIENTPISLVSFQADTFASTMRTNHYEEYNSVKFVLQLINQWDRQQIVFDNVWYSLVFSKPSHSKENRFTAARQLRGKVFDNILKAKSVVDQFETLFFDCYKYLAKEEPTGYKNYKSLFQFLTVYEQFIQFKNTNMDANLQDRAIKLGSSIGQAIINYENGDKRSNAKSGRRYIIDLHKSRTREQFLDAIIRIQRKYALSISRDISEGINDNNFMFIKQLALISALNQLNSILSFSNNSNEK